MCTINFLGVLLHTWEQRGKTGSWTRGVGSPASVVVAAVRGSAQGLEEGSWHGLGRVLRAGFSKKGPTGADSNQMRAGLPRKLEQRDGSQIGSDGRGQMTSCWVQLYPGHVQEQVSWKDSLERYASGQILRSKSKWVGKVWAAVLLAQ